MNTPAIRAVVTDIEMPSSMDGLALSHRMVAEMPWVAVLMTSGRNLREAETLFPSTRFMPKLWHAGKVLRHLERLRDCARGMATAWEAELRSQKNLGEK